MADSLNTPTLPENRLDLEALIEAAIARLDEIEPDPDLEEEPDLEDGGDDEPCLASTAMQDRYNRHTLQDDDLEFDDSDREPSLASTNSLDQRKWWYGRNDDAEHEHDGLEPCCEDEGAACEDEGSYDGDCGIDDDDPGFADPGKTLAVRGWTALQYFPTTWGFCLR